MDFQTALEQTLCEEPQLLYLSGKTATGKTTFATQLHDAADYRIVELDKLVVTAVMQSYHLPDRGRVFSEVYKRRGQLHWIQAFTRASQAEINKHLAAAHKLIIEGAVAHPQTLQELLRDLPAVTFLYFHPHNLDNYQKNLANRFKTARHYGGASLPEKFWRLIDKNDFQRFLRDKKITSSLANGIKAYARLSQAESTHRLTEFRRHFADIRVIEV